MGKLVRKSPESLLGNSSTTDNFLIRYRDFESKYGIIRMNDISGSNIHPVFYSSNLWNSKWFSSNCTVEYDYYGGSYPMHGIRISNYYLNGNANGNPISGERDRIIDLDNYFCPVKIYHVATYPPSRFNVDHGDPKDRYGYNLSYKAIIWLGHKQIHSGSTNTENPLIAYNYTGSSASQSQLANIKTYIGPSSVTPGSGTSSSNLGNNVDSFSFGAISLRYSAGGNLPEGSSWQIKRKQRYAYNGTIKTCCSGNPTNWDYFMNENYSGSDLFTFAIPGDWQDDTDSNTWWMYGICATDTELADNSYIELSGYQASNHTTHLILYYIGQENPWASSGQSYSSITGFVNCSTSDKPDYKDNLRYIYIFRKQFSRGFDCSSNFKPIIVDSLVNNHKKIKIILRYSCTPPSGNVNCYKFRISFHYDIKYYTGSGYGHVTGDCDFTTNRIDAPYGLSNSETMVESNIWAYHKGSYPNTVTFSNVKYGIAYDTSGWNPSTPSLNKTLTIINGNSKTPTETIGKAELSVSFDFTTSGNNCSCLAF